jgi:hypothetical protein
MIRSKYFAKAVRYLHEFGLLDSFFIPEFKNKVNDFFQEYFFNAVLPMKRNCRNLFWDSVTFATDEKVKKLSENFVLNSENQIIFAKGHEDFQWNSPIEIFHLFES